MTGSCSSLAKGKRYRGAQHTAAWTADPDRQPGDKLRWCVEKFAPDGAVLAPPSSSALRSLHSRHCWV